VRAPEVWIHEIPQALMLLFPCQQKKQTNNNNKRNIIFIFIFLHYENPNLQV
jgi:hypothetical protein